MGIPYYFKTITNTYPNILKSSLIETPTRLFLDFNCAIHQCSQELLQSYDEQNKKFCHKEFEEMLITKCIEHVIYLIEYVQAQTIVFIAIDGVAPVAKMIQQRKRRYLTHWRNSQMSSKSRIEWNSNAISPGTAFMNSLNIRLNDLVNTHNEKGNTFKMIISDSSLPGEGEFKIFNYIEEENHSDNEIDVIYGLDADLIMLSLLSSKTSKYLMRENCYIDNKNQEDKNIMYLDINLLSKNLYLHLQHHVHFQTLEKHTCIQIYIFICFFIGNDFIPNLSFLKLKNDAVDFLLYNYDKIMTKMTNSNKLNIGEIIYYCCNSKKWQIDYGILCNFIELLSESEDFEYIKHHRKYYVRSTQRTTKDNKILLYGHFNKPVDTITPESKGWRDRYYSSLFNDKLKDTICNDYITGLKWVVDYYYNKKCDTKWCYVYSYSPTILDIYNYLGAKSTIVNDIFRKDIPISSVEYVSEGIQLLYILPKQSSNLLPNHLQLYTRDLMKGLLHYYPIDYKIQTYMHYYLHECIPIIPYINIGKFEKLINKQ